MEHPREWIVLGQQLHPDFVLIHGDFRTGFRSAILTFSHKERARIERYLSYLVESDISKDEKFEAWIASKSDLFPSVSQIQEFLMELLKLTREC